MACQCCKFGKEKKSEGEKEIEKLKQKLAKTKENKKMKIKCKIPETNHKLITEAIEKTETKQGLIEKTKELETKIQELEAENKWLKGE